jgi:hypothetical protein
MNAPLERHVERRAAPQQLDEILSRMNEIAEAQKAISARQEAIEADLKRNSTMTAEIVELFQTAKGAFVFFGYIGNFIKWVGGIAIAIAFLWAAFKKH